MAILTQIRAFKSDARRRFGRRAAGFAARLASPFARLLAHNCLLCAAAGSDAIICRDCAAELPRLPATTCPRCALPTPGGEICGRCLAQPPNFDATLAAYRYDFPLDKLIQSFKYGHRLALAPYLGEQLVALAGALVAAGGADTAPLIVPLPLHRQRLRQRGFNQALELARPVARRLAIALDAAHC